MGRQALAAVRAEDIHPALAGRIGRARETRVGVEEQVRIEIEGQVVDVLVGERVVRIEGWATSEGQMRGRAGAELVWVMSQYSPPPTTAKPPTSAPVSIGRSRAASASRSTSSYPPPPCISGLGSAT